MNLQNAETIARSLMDQHGLQDYTLDMNYSMKKTMGRCNYREKIISLSTILVVLNPEPQVRNTILHEIAHGLREAERGYVPYQLTPSMWHDARWTQIARSIGCDGKQFYNSPGTQLPVNTGYVRPVKHPWIKTCSNCGVTGTVLRRNKRMCCSQCVRTTGRYIPWTYTPNK